MKVFALTSDKENGFYKVRYNAYKYKFNNNSIIM